MIDSIDSLGYNPNRKFHCSSDTVKPAALKGHHVFLNALPESWSVLPINHPIIHYEVAIPDHRTPRPVKFGVHIVCQAPLAKGQDVIALTIECEKLKYIIDQFKKPVIVVAVDNVQKLACWLLVQDCISCLPTNQSADWRSQKNVTLHLPVRQLLASPEQLQQSVYGCLELIYTSHFHRYYETFNNRTKRFFVSENELELALQVESNRRYAAGQSSCAAGSCGCENTDEFQAFTMRSDSQIQASLEKAQSMKLLDAKENRQAYYCISQALEVFGDRASAGIRYTARGEMLFYDFLLHFKKAFDGMGNRSILHLTHPEDYSRYFSAVKELTDIITQAIDEGEIIAASLLTIRLADTYLFAAPHIMRTFNQETAAPLTEYAQSMLVTAHEMASLVEVPERAIQ
ncbi:hypothetical protein JCM39194_04350 [Desulfotomaculum varum]